MRVLAALLVVVMLLPIVSFAELIEMSMEDLLNLKSQVDAELIRRDLNPENVIPQGKYLVGRDIKPGTYELLTNWLAKDGNVFISTFDANGKQTSIFQFENVGEMATIFLEENGTLILRDCSVIIKETKQSWKP